MERRSMGKNLNLKACCLGIILVLGPILIVTTTQTPIFASSACTQNFAEDFSTSPDGNGRWTIHRYPDPDSGVWDPIEQVFYLTKVPNGTSVAMFVNCDLTARNWTANFRYQA